MIQKIFYLNGSFVPERQATVSVTDLGLLRNYGVFEYFRTYNKKPFRLEDHLNRFFKSAKALNLKSPYSRYQLRTIIFKLIKKNHHLKELSFRMVLTGGNTRDGKTSSKPNFFIIVGEPHRYPKKAYQQGIKLLTLNYQREFPEIKSLNYTLAVANWNELIKQDGLEYLYVSKNKVYEASTSNFFIVNRNTLITPEQKVLDGVTKKVVIELAQKNHIKVKQKELTLTRVLAADEAFITATDKKILPVIKIDNYVIGNGKVGKITRKLMNLFENYTKNW